MDIGADPEFFLIDKHGRVKKAKHVPFFNKVGEKQRIGRDGGRIPVEIRPPPFTITKLPLFIHEIEDILREISLFCNKKGYTIRAGASDEYKDDSYAIGGHFHLGSNKLHHVGNQRSGRYMSYDEYTNNIRREREQERQKYRHQELLQKQNTNKMVRVFDTYFIPLTLFLIDLDEIYNRRYNGYGILGDYRRQKWGIEYRTPYSFIISPFLTRSLYAIVSLLAYNYKQIKIKSDIEWRFKKFYEEQSGSMKKLKLIYDNIKPQLLKLIKYNNPNPIYTSDILSLFNIIERGKRCKSLDVLKNYKLKKPYIPKPKKEDNRLKISIENSYHLECIYKRCRRNRNIKLLKSHNSDRLYIYRHWHYEVDGSRSKKKAIILSKAMPSMKYYPADVKVKHLTSDVKYSIGITEALLAFFNRNKRSVNFLINYIENECKGLNKNV